MSREVSRRAHQTLTKTVAAKYYLRFKKSPQRTDLARVIRDIRRIEDQLNANIQ